jgi:hypothetical protein
MGNDCEIILIATAKRHTAVSDPTWHTSIIFGRPQIVKNTRSGRASKCKILLPRAVGRKRVFWRSRLLRNRQIPLN